MAATADVRDPALREGLEAAEAALDDGNYSDAVQRVVEVYRRAVAGRPELVVPFADVRGRLPAPGDPPLARRAPTWPDLGVGMSKNERGEPEFEFRKHRFSMSEAVTYFEYVLEVVARSQ